MVIAAAGALSVATAASATAATWGQGAPARADGSAEITQETNTHGAIAHGAVMRQAAAPEAMAQKATAQEATTQESTAPGAVVAPRLAVTDQIAGPIAETATEQGSATWVQRAYQVRLTAVQDAIAQRKAAAKAAAARVTQSQAAQGQAAQGQAAQGQAAQGQAAQGQAAQSPAGTTAASGSPQQIAQAMLGSFGWSSSQFSCLDPLWAHESGWSVSAYNAGSGAFGIPQALPGSKMSTAGPDWQTNAATQIKWGLDYIKGSYGSPCGAWSHEEATGWY
jgi:hypothetical protein